MPFVRRPSCMAPKLPSPLHALSTASRKLPCCNGKARYAGLGVSEARRPGAGILRSRIGEIAAEKRCDGYRRIHVLLKREGFTMNVKRTYRLYREAGKHTTAVRQSRIVKPRRGRWSAHRTGGAISPGLAALTAPFL